MRSNFFLVAFVALGVVVHGVIALGDDEENARPDSAAIAARALAITDVVLQRHIDPPTRQELILSGVKALYRAENKPVAAGLSSRVSQLAGADELAKFVRETLDQFDKLESAEAVFTGGMFAALPGGANLIAADTNRVNEQIRNNRYVGVGIALAIDGESKLPAIPKVFYNGPAGKAGVKAGDVILEIDSQSTAKMQMDDVLSALRGEEGTEVSVVVRRTGQEKPLEFTITRNRVFIPTVLGVREKEEGQWQYTLDSASDVALVRLTSIGPSTLAELRQLEGRLHREKVRGVIFDLRSGGATLHEVILMADALLDGGVIGRVRGLDKVETFEAKPGSLFSGLPLAILVGKSTTSGQVFLTAALQDLGRATVVGETPAAETYVRSLIDLPGRDDKLVFATAEMQRGDGTPLLGRNRGAAAPQLVRLDDNSAQAKHRPGYILPDHVVAEVADMDGSNDVALLKAIEVLKTAIARAPAAQGDHRRTEG